MNRQAILGVGLALSITGAVAVYAQSGSSDRNAASRTGGHVVYTDGAGVAIDGYDPVAYFTAGKPTRGAAEHSLQWHGATWRFASAENRDAFRENPEKYAPAYGGYCAYGVAAANALFEIDPNAWRIVDGTLYLNKNAEVQRLWNGDIGGYIRQGDANWPGIVSRSAG